MSQRSESPWSCIGCSTREIAADGIFPSRVDPSLEIWNQAIEQFSKLFEALPMFQGEGESENEPVPNNAC
jgi:hypothetical protein